MQRSKRLLAALGVVAMLGAGLAACSSTPTAATKPAPTSAAGVSAKIDKSKVKKDLVVGIDNPYYLFSEDVLIAAKMGYFKQYGIDSVKIITSDNPLPGLIGGSLDFANYDTDTAIAAAAKGSNIKFLSVYLGGEANILGVGPGINSAADLKGKTITGGQFGSRNDFIMRQLLKDNGIDPDKDVKMVSTGGQSDARLQAVISGTVDGASLQLRHKTLLEAAGGKFLFQEENQVPQNGWSAGKILTEYPDTAAAFLAATLKARKWVEDPANKNALFDYMVSKKFDMPQAYRDAYSEENAPTYHTADGGFETKDMDKFISEQIKFDVIKKGTDWRDYTDLVPLWTAQKALGMPLRPDPASLGK